MLRARKLGPLCELGLQPPLMENPEVPARGLLLATAELVFEELRAGLVRAGTRGGVRLAAVETYDEDTTDLLAPERGLIPLGAVQCGLMPF